MLASLPISSCFSWFEEPPRCRLLWLLPSSILSLNGAEFPVVHTSSTTYCLWRFWQWPFWLVLVNHAALKTEVHVSSRILIFSGSKPRSGSVGWPDQKCRLQFIVTAWKELFYLVGMFRTLSPGDSISVALRKLLQGVRRVKSGYMKICNKGSRHSEYQRSGIKLRDLAFCVWEGASLWARWICMHLSYLGRIAFPCSPCFLRSSSSSAITVMGWQHLQDHSLGSPRSHLEARSCWWLWHFLFINMAGGIFISQEVLLCLVFFCLFVLRNPMLLCIFPVPIYIPAKGEGGFLFLWALCGT